MRMGCGGRKDKTAVTDMEEIFSGCDRRGRKADKKSGHVERGEPKSSL